MKIGLALSGGGVRGAAHIGVLQALIEEGIEISHVSGTSSGSIIASLYALGYTPKEMANIFSNYCKFVSKPDKLIPLKFIKSIFTGKINIKGFSNGDNLERLINKYCYRKGIIDISDLDKALAIPAVDLKTEKLIYYLNRKLPDAVEEKDTIYRYHGSIPQIVRASSSFPGIFVPKKINDLLLIDGGVSTNTPVSILKNMGADFVIAVSFDNSSNLSNQYNIVNVTLKAFEIMGENLNKNEIDIADINIVPNIKNCSLLDCSKVIYNVNAGYVATKNAINNIKEKIKNY